MLLVVIHMTHFSRQIFRSSYSSLPRTGVEIYLFKNLITSLIAFQFIFLVGTRRTLNTQISLPHLYFLKKLLEMTKTRIIFSNGVSLFIQITLKGRSHAQLKMTNTKQTHWVFWSLFCLLFPNALFVLLYFSLTRSFAYILYYGF